MDKIRFVVIPQTFIIKEIRNVIERLYLNSQGNLSPLLDLSLFNLNGFHGIDLSISLNRYRYRFPRVSKDRWISDSDVDYLDHFIF